MSNSKCRKFIQNLFLYTRVSNSGYISISHVTQSFSTQTIRYTFVQKYKFKKPDTNVFFSDSIPARSSYQATALNDKCIHDIWTGRTGCVINFLVTIIFPLLNPPLIHYAYTSPNFKATTDRVSSGFDACPLIILIRKLTVKAWKTKSSRADISYYVVQNPCLEWDYKWESFSSLFFLRNLSLHWIILHSFQLVRRKVISSHDGGKAIGVICNVDDLDVNCVSIATFMIIIFVISIMMWEPLRLGMEWNGNDINLLWVLLVKMIVLRKLSNPTFQITNVW